MGGRGGEGRGRGGEGRGRGGEGEGRGGEGGREGRGGRGGRGGGDITQLSLLASSDTSLAPSTAKLLVHTK